MTRRIRQAPRRTCLRLQLLESRHLLATISGVHFSDENRNGVQDPGEIGFGGASVALLDNVGFFLRETFTDAGGRYEFDDLPADNYYVRVSSPAGMHVAAPSTLGRAIEPISGFENPLAVGSGFLDGDSQPEVFVMQGGANPSVTILRDVNDDLNPVTDVTIAPDPQSLSVADLNPDGFSDFAVTHGGGTIEIFVNDQRGGFLPSVIHPVGRLPRGLVADDFDQDGDVDIAVANNFDSTVTLLANDGSGTFLNVGVTAAGPGPESIAVADIDGDGLKDLLISNLGNAQVGGGITLLLNTTANFDLPSFSPNTVNLDSPVFDVAVDRFFDTNLDGDVTPTDTPQIMVALLGDPRPDSGLPAPKLAVMDAVTLAVLREFGLEIDGDVPALKDGTTAAITTGDFDNDGDLDLAIAATNAPEVIFFANQNRIHFTERILGGFLGQFSTTTKAVVTSLDVDLDGDLDFVVADQTSSGSTPGDAHLLRTVLRGSDVRITLDASDEIVNNVHIASEPLPFTVKSTGDGSDTDLSDGVAMAADGTVTLRAAIEQANALDRYSIIDFDIPGIGPHVISPASPLPTIDRQIVFDGAPSRPGTKRDPVIHIDGGGSLRNGFEVNPVTGVLFKGLAFSNFTESSINVLESDPVLFGTSDVLLADQSVELRLAGQTVVQSSADALGPLRLEEPSGDVLQIDASILRLEGRITTSVGMERRLSLSGRDQTLDLTSLDDSALRGIDIVDLADVTRHRLVLNPSEISNLATRGVLRLVSDPHDTIDLGGQGYVFDRVVLESQRLVHSFIQGTTTIVFEGPTNWTNPINSFDVNLNQSVTTSDALAVINELGRRKFSGPGGDFIDLALVELSSFRFYDVSRDNRVTALDALQVVNQLGRIASLENLQAAAELNATPSATRRSPLDLVWSRYEFPRPSPAINSNRDPIKWAQIEVTPRDPVARDAEVDLVVPPAARQIDAIIRDGLDLMTLSQLDRLDSIAVDAWTIAFW